MDLKGNQNVSSYCGWFELSRVTCSKMYDGNPGKINFC